MTDGAAVTGNPFTEPKRGPGRPPGAPNKKRSHHKKPAVPGAIRETAPKREPAVVPKYVYQGVGMFVVAGNAGLNFALPRIQVPVGPPGPDGKRPMGPLWMAEDQLTGDELGALIQVLGDEALTNRALAEWLTKVGKAAGANVHARVVYVLASIMVPRLARRGLVPEELQSVINAFNQPIPAPGPAEGQAPVGAPTAPGFDFDGAAGAGDIPPVPVASGGTPDDDRGHGEREVQPGSVPEPVPAMVRDVSQQSGHGGLSGAANQNGHGAGEPEGAPVGAGARS